MQPTGEWLRQPGGLAERLLRLRRAAGLTGDQLAGMLGWGRPKISKLENGRQMPSRADVEAWAAACGHPEVTGELLEQLDAAQVAHRQYRHRIRGGQAAIQEELAALLRDAKRIRNFEILFIPGLLQTPGYARARIMDAVRHHGFSDATIDKDVAARMRRQEILYDGDREFEFVIMEIALLVRTCPAEVMLGQLDRLQTVSDLPNVTLGIIPLDAGLDPAPDVGFLVAGDIAYVETSAAETLVHGDEAATYARFADLLLAQAVTGEAARGLITSAGQRARRFLAG